MAFRYDDFNCRGVVTKLPLLQSGIQALLDTRMQRNQEAVEMMDEQKNGIPEKGSRFGQVWALR